jgi:hypothetical protein
MNPYEIEQIEKQMRAGFQLPLQMQEWSDVERKARQERALILAKMFREFFAAAYAKITGAARQVRSTAADCTGARLRHDH